MFEEKYEFIGIGKYEELSKKIYRSSSKEKVLPSRKPFAAN